MSDIETTSAPPPAKRRRGRAVKAKTALSAPEEKEEKCTDRIAAVVEQMPRPEACVFHWTTIAAVRIRTLFEAVKQIICEGVLIADKAEFILEKQLDSSQTMVVFFRMTRDDLLAYGTYKCDERLPLPLSIDEFYKGAKCINQSDVVGICVTMESMSSGYPTLDLYIMHPGLGYCYQFKTKLLHREYMDFPVVDINTEVQFDSELKIDSGIFKRYLVDCASHGPNVIIRNGHMVSNNLSYTEFIPTDNDTTMTDMRIRLFPKPNLDPSHEEPNEQQGVSRKYALSKLMLFTKATALSNKVSILQSKKFPLVVEYKIGNAGVIRFLLSHVHAEQEIQEEEEDEDEDEEQVTTLDDPAAVQATVMDWSPLVNDASIPLSGVD